MSLPQVSLPQLHSLTAMDWWGRSEETIPEEVPEDLVQRAFTEHGDGAVQRPNVPTQVASLP